MREDFVRRQAEEEAYHAQQVSVFPFFGLSEGKVSAVDSDLLRCLFMQVLLQKAEEQRRKLLALEEEKLTQQRAK